MPFQTTMVATSTSTGTTGGVKTQLNGGNPLIIPAAVTQIMDFIPYTAPIAAITAAQSGTTRIDLESQDIQPNISPKSYIEDPTMGGLGTFPFALTPALRAVPINVTCLGGNRLNVYGTSLNTNSAAYRTGVGFTISDGSVPMGQQLYWDCTGNTSTGASAARVQGSDITVSAGQRLKKVYQRLYVNGTPTASESLVGYGEFVSNGFVDAIPLTFPLQNTATGLGANIGMGTPAGQDWNVDIGLRNPGTGQVTVNTYLNIEEANTNPQGFASGLAYTR